MQQGNDRQHADVKMGSDLPKLSCNRLIASPGFESKIVSMLNSILESLNLLESLPFLCR
jgi:hypothetical protein